MVAVVVDEVSVGVEVSVGDRVSIGLVEALAAFLSEAFSDFSCQRRARSRRIPMRSNIRARMVTAMAAALVRRRLLLVTGKMDMP